MRFHSPILKNSSEIHTYIYRNEGEKVKQCLQRTIESVNSRDSEGKTPLMVAASFNRHDIIDILLAYMCDVNLHDSDGNTALHEATDGGYTEVVRKIIKSGRCDANITNLRGETALMKAAVYDYVDIVRILLKIGSADPDFTDISGQTALLVALREGSHLTVDALVKAGCDVNIINKLGESALFIAIHSPLMRTLEPTKRLIEAGYDVSIDKMWLLNEEKHNLFYQDDELYTTLRRNVRRGSSGDTYVNAIYTLAEQSAVESIVSKPPLQRTPSSPPLSMSRTVRQKIISTDVFTNGVAMDWSTPPGSPLHSRRNSSRSSSSTNRPSLSSKASSFESDTIGSPCLSPVVMSYPAAHINFHMLTRQMSDSSAYAAETASTPSVKTSFERLSEVNDFLKTSDTKAKFYKRQQSEGVSSNRKFQPESRKISLPSKPSVRFCSQVQILSTS